MPTLLARLALLALLAFAPALARACDHHASAAGGTHQAAGHAEAHVDASRAGAPAAADAHAGHDGHGDQADEGKPSGGKGCGGQGCCSEGACQCACMHASPGDAPKCGMAGAGAKPGDPSAAAPSCGHADAERAPLIRPPSDTPASGA